MNFLQVAKNALARQGVSLVFASLSAGAYNVELGKSTVSRTNHTVRMYPKQIIANQYNFPALVGKETIMFYLANDSLTFTPKINDEIEYKSKTYKVQSIQEHFAKGAADAIRGGMQVAMITGIKDKRLS